VTRVEAFLEDVAEWARGEPGVRAALLVGSQARADSPADDWSDVDVVLFVDDPGRLAGDGGWLASFGSPELTFVEPTPVAGILERRVLFADGLEADFALFPAAALPALSPDAEIASVVARGYRLLHDELDLETALSAVGRAADERRREPGELVHDFWYHALWTAKKLRRGEAVTARDCLEGRLKPLLVELGREHALRRDPAADTWHRDRFVERWADPRVVAAVWRATASSPDALAGALWELCDDFDSLAADVMAPDPGAAAARGRLAGLLPPA